MLAAILVPSAFQIKDQLEKLAKLDEAELRRVHDKYKGLIKWITSKSKAKDYISQSLIDELEKTSLTKLRDVLQLDDEEAIILLLFASQL